MGGARAVRRVRGCGRTMTIRPKTHTSDTKIVTMRRTASRIERNDAPTTRSTSSTTRPTSRGTSAYSASWTSTSVEVPPTRYVFTATAPAGTASAAIASPSTRTERMKPTIAAERGDTIVVSLMTDAAPVELGNVPTSARYATAVGDAS